MPSEQEIIDRLQSRVPMPDATLRQDTITMLRLQLRTAEHEIARLQKVVDAARDYIDEIGDVPYSHINWDRLATYEAFNALVKALGEG